MAKKRSNKQKKISLIKSRRTRAINKIKKLDISKAPERTKIREISRNIMMFNKQLDEVNGRNFTTNKIPDGLDVTELGHAWETSYIIEYLQDLNPDYLNGINTRLYPHKIVEMVYKYCHSMTSREVLVLNFDDDDNKGFLSINYEN